MANSEAVAKYRRNRKEKLVALFGDECYDCGLQFPPYVFDFDHRDPSQKEFSLSGKGMCYSWERTLTEAEKCDMVCANCHRHRTHKRACKGCSYCNLL